MKINNTLVFLIIVILTFIGMKALIHPGFYTNHDGAHQIIRLVHFHLGLKDGQFPVRWAGHALDGYGYPLFIFTYRLPFWFAESWYLLTHSLAGSIKFAFIITYFLSGISMYFFASQLWKSKLSGLFSAIIYLWSPYRFLNIYVRAALGESAIFMILPLIYLGIYKLHQKNKISFVWITVTALSISAFILTHAMAAGIWLIPIFLWALLFFASAGKKWLFVKQMAVSGLLALLTSSYYWIPAFYQRQFTQFSSALGSYFKDHFVSIKQLVYMPWGYGFSMPGVNDDAMSFQVGLANWIVLGLGVMVLLFYLLKRKQAKNLNVLIYSNLIFLLSIFFMLDYSEKAYRYITSFFTIDIPWRFLSVSVFMTCILAGALSKLILNKRLKIFAVCLVTALALYANRNHIKVNQYTEFSDEEWLKNTATSNQHDDYAPRWFNKSSSDFEEFDRTDSLFLVTGGEADVIVNDKKSNMLSLSADVFSDNAEIVVRNVYYPGWILTVDDAPSKVSHIDGRIKLELSKGKHDVNLTYHETKDIKIGNILSIAGIAIIILMFVYEKNKKRT